MKRSKHTAGYYAAFSLAGSLMDLMKRKGITKANLATMTGESRPTVTKWFSPGRNLTIFTAASIADALGAELKISVVEKNTDQCANDNGVWGTGTFPESREVRRLASDEAPLMHGTHEEGVSAVVRTTRFVPVLRVVRGAADCS